MLALNVGCGSQESPAASPEPASTGEPAPEQPANGNGNTPGGNEIGAEETPRSDEVAEAEPLDEEAAPPAQPPRPYQCITPPIPIPRPRECVRGRGYPRCKWQMPHATLSGGRYRRWRNTIMEHWWGRPSLVAYILASLDDYERVFPEQVVAVGDLDAPGPRHRTHDNGVDFDIYLLGALMVENAGAGNYPNNYEGKSDEEIEALRQRVETLARVFASCAEGKIRIYYNDPVVLERFHTWYDTQGFEPNPFGRPMQAHNRLHDFHFHVTIPEDLPLPEMTPLPDGVTHPIARIEAPPPPESAPHLSSMNRRPGQ